MRLYRPRRASIRVDLCVRLYVVICGCFKQMSGRIMISRVCGGEFFCSQGSFRFYPYQLVLWCSDILFAYLPIAALKEQTTLSKVQQSSVRLFRKQEHGVSVYAVLLMTMTCQYSLNCVVEFGCLHERLGWALSKVHCLTMLYGQIIHRTP